MKSYDEYIREFDFFIEDSLLSKADKEKIKKLKRFFISKFNYLNTLENKYLNDVTKKIQEDIKYRIIACKRNKQIICSKMQEHTLNFGCPELASLDRKITEYERLDSNLYYYYLDVLSDEFDYNDSEVEKLFNDCLTGIESQSNIKPLFFGKTLSNSDIVSKILEFIKNENLVEKYKKIISLQKEIRELRKKKNKFSFLKKHLREINRYFDLEDAIDRDTKYIRRKSDEVDSLKKTLEFQESNWLFRKIKLSANTQQRLDVLDIQINKRYSNQLKRVGCRKTINDFFNRHGFVIDELSKYLYCDESLFENILKSVDEEINNKETMLKEIGLTDEEFEYLNDNYITIVNIINYIVNSKTNMVNLYIIYILCNLDSIVADKLKASRNDEYSVNDVIAKYKTLCNEQIENISNGRTCKKIKTRVI